jgi:hypothetical protein
MQWMPSTKHGTRNYLPAQVTSMDRPDKVSIVAPAAWLHTLWMEGGQFKSVVTDSEESAFGVPGEDHSKCYPVTTEPLYRLKKIKKPRVRVD